MPRQQALPTTIGIHRVIHPQNQQPALFPAPSSCKVRHGKSPLVFSGLVFRFLCRRDTQECLVVCTITIKMKTRASSFVRCVSARLVLILKQPNK